MNISEAVAAIEAQFSPISKTEFRGETTLQVPLERFHEIAQLCKKLGFTYLVDISSVDQFGQEPRFEVVYELFHFEGNFHLRLKYAVSEDRLEAPTVTDLWQGANWHEREVYDMMGIRFRGHPDLRRILMWEGYPYYPMRKDFPLAGKTSDMPEVAFSNPAPLAGGPFVTVPSCGTSKDREPRSRE